MGAYGTTLCITVVRAGREVWSRPVDENLLVPLPAYPRLPLSDREERPLAGEMC